MNMDVISAESGFANLMSFSLPMFGPWQTIGEECELRSPRKKLRDFKHSPLLNLLNGGHLLSTSRRSHLSLFVHVNFSISNIL